MEAIISQTFHYISHIWRPELLLALFIFPIVRSIWVARRNNSFISWPVFGILPSYLLALRSNFHDVATDILQNYNGTFRLKGPRFCDFAYVVTSDPRNLEYIFKTNFFNFRKGQSTYTIMHDFLGDSHFTMDDDAWHSLRKLFQLNLSLAEFNKMAAEMIVTLVQTRLLPVMDGFVEEAVVFDLQDVLSRLSFDHNCSIALGVDPGSLAPGLPTIEFATAFKNAAEVTALRFFIPQFVWKLMRYFSSGAERGMKSSIKRINEFAYNVINSRKASKPSDTDSRPDLLSLLMQTKDEDGNCFPDSFLRDNCLFILLAGSDTIAVALSWFFWLLHQNPMVEKRIFAEACTIVGQMSNLSAILRPEEVKKMHYLHAALTESLRLYPPVPLNQTEVYNDDQLPSGVKVKKGVRMITLMYSMGRMESIWGEDCREFRPERWLRNGKFIPVSQYKFPAFNAGLRSCLGKDLGYYQMKVIAASIIYRYRVSVVENQSIVPRLSMMLHMKHGLNVTLSRRNESEVDYIP